MSTITPDRYREYIGKTQSMVDRVERHLIDRLAATLDVSVPDGSHLPALWHWLLFQEWVPAHAVGSDGHPRRGSFLPADPALPRRMWGAGRAIFHRPLRIGEVVERTSTVLRISEKNGASGRMLLATVGHEITGEHGPAISEEQDILYRGADVPALKSLPLAPAPPQNAFSRQLVPDSVLLFRFSALTGNGHRIHYDESYAKDVEGYPALVVHGPLQAICLADLLARHHPAAIARFEFRGQRAALMGRTLQLEGWLDEKEQKSARLQTRDPDGCVCMQASATFVA